MVNKLKHISLLNENLHLDFSEKIKMIQVVLKDYYRENNYEKALDIIEVIQLENNQLFDYFVYLLINQKYEYIKENNLFYSAMLSFCCQQYLLREACILIILLKVSGCDEEDYIDGLIFLNYQKRVDGYMGYINPIDFNLSMYSEEFLLEKFYIPNTVFSLLVYYILEDYETMEELQCKIW